MAQKKGRSLGRLARAMALGAALGSAKPATSAPSQQDQASQLYRAQSAAKNIARQNAQDPHAAVELQLDNLQAQINQGSQESTSPSLDAQQDGQGNIKLNLKFNVPTPSDTQKQVISQRQVSKSPTQTPRQIETQQPSGSSLDTPASESTTPDATPDELEADGSDVVQDNNQSLSNETKPEVGGDENREEIEPNEEEGDGEPEQAEEEDQNKLIEEGLAEEQATQAKAVQQQAQTEVAENQNEEAAQRQRQQAGKEIIKQTQNAEAQMKQDMQIRSQASQAEKIKRDLDNKIRNLKAKKLPLQVALRTAQVLKISLSLAKMIVAILSYLFLSPLLAWTIVLAIVGFILKGVSLLLKFTIEATKGLIKLIKSKLKSIDDEIEKTKANQQKAISVIQSSYRQKRTGGGASPQKPEVPQEA